MRNILLLALLFLLTSCNKYVHNTRTAYTNYKVDETLTSGHDETIADLIAPYKERLDAEMNAVVGTCPITLTKDKNALESTLGNWMADAIYAKADEYRPIDFALQNKGGVRIGEIVEGEVTRGKIFELMPFDNQLVVLEMNGKGVQELLNHIVNLGGWPVSKSLRVEVKDGVAQNIVIKEKPLDENEIYTVALPDYIANGGDKCRFLADHNRTDYPQLIRDILLEYLKNNPEMTAQIEGRIKNID